MNFSDFAYKVQSLLLKHLDNPAVARFKRNSRGIFQKVMYAPLIIKNGEELQRKGEIKLYYAEQNPNGISKEAQIIRAGVWKTYQVSWLWIWYRNKRIWLARVNPDEKSYLSIGWISNRGEVIIERRSLF